MEYFLIRSCAVTPFEPMHMDRSLYTNLMTEEAFEKLPDDIIYYYHLSAETELPEVVFRPTFMAGDGLHDIISLYDETIRWKNMQIFPDVEEFPKEAAKGYWIPLLKEYRCLHGDTVLLPDRTTKKPILDRSRLHNMDIFRISGVNENLVAVSLALAESISRRELYGVIFERLEVR